MARMAKIIGTVVLGLALTGCVSQEKYNALKLDRDGLAEQLAKSQSDASSARAAPDRQASSITAPTSIVRMSVLRRRSSGQFSCRGNLGQFSCPRSLRVILQGPNNQR